MENNKNVENRTTNSIFNASSKLIIYILKTILMFITRTIFIKTLGETYLGVNGLLTNILSMLSLAELGLSSAISFGLYKPLAEKDDKKTSEIMTFFKRVYKVIGIIVLAIGIIVFMFLNKIIKEYDSIPQLNIIYILYLINTVSTYYTSYKEVLIIADQKEYELTRINVAFTVLLYVLQSLTLIIFKDFIIYLIVQFFIQIIQKIIINKYITTNYKNIDFSCDSKLDTPTLKLIKTNVKAMIFHQIGNYCINGTDNIIISNKINVDTVGIYSNYNMITTMMNTIITTICNSVTASFGNLLVEKKEERSKEIFLIIDFISFVLYSFGGMVCTCLATRFIKIWIGEAYTLEPITIILISFSFFFTGLRIACTVVRNAAGLYNEDKWVPIVQSIINLVISIILANYIGINGVVLGTIISSIVPNFYRSYILYKNIFKEKYKNYLKEYYIWYILFYIITISITYYVSSCIKIEKVFGLIVTFIAICLIYCIVLYVFFRKSKGYLYIKEKVINSIGRKNNEKQSEYNNPLL